MIFKIIFPQKFAEKNGVFVQNTASFRKITITTLVFQKNANCPPKIMVITLTHRNLT
jgi:hypothetical protein